MVCVFVFVKMCVVYAHIILLSINKHDLRTVYMCIRLQLLSNQFFR